LVTKLGKGVIRAKDTRTSSPTGRGVSILATFITPGQFGLGFDEVDA